MGTMSVMGKGGDTKTIWDPQKQDEVGIAKETFDKLTGKGYKAYTVLGDGKKGKRMRTFDSEAGKVILIPPIVGG